MPKQDLYFNEAIKYANKSSFRQRLGAVVVHNGKIVGRGFNFAHSTGAHPLLDGDHAEISAIKNTTARFRKDSILYVCRIMKGKQKLGLAKPCKMCVTIMKKVGIKKVWYSTNYGWEKITL